ncbi:helix-turn-helix domain-containing protein [Leucobacter sp. GX24907]
MTFPISRTPARALGVRLREIRLEADLSQQDLARISALHPSHVGRIERGSVNPSLETLTQLAGALGCTVSDLTAYVVTPPPLHTVSSAEY